MIWKPWVRARDANGLLTDEQWGIRELFGCRKQCLGRNNQSVTSLQQKCQKKEISIDQSRTKYWIIAPAGNLVNGFQRNLFLAFDLQDSSRNAPGGESS